MFVTRRSCVLLMVLAVVVAPEVSRACPFCAAVSLTFSEEIGGASAAVIAKLVKLPAVSKKPGADAFGAADDSGKATFEIVEVLKGEKVLGQTKKVEVVYFGDAEIGATFLIMGIDGPPLNWSTPIALSERGRKYISDVISLPKDGVDRLAFFQTYLEDSEDLLSRDAYDEFAKVPFSGVRELKDRMNHDQIVKWVKDQKVPVSRRRLYLTMLGVCGTPEDAAMLEEMIRSDDRQAKAGLDALVAAYLTLKGPEGMPLIEDLFLKNEQVEYVDTYAVIMALRFHGQEEKVIPRERLVEGLRHILDRPQLADLVIPDLARWEDWASLDRLVTLFKNADEESSWVRVPVVNYLRACPLPEAKTAIAELEKIDPDAVKRANTLFPFGGAAAPKVAAAQAAGSKPTGTPAAASKTTDGGKSATDVKTTDQKSAADNSAETKAAPSDGKPSRGADALKTSAIAKTNTSEPSASSGGVPDNWKLAGGLVAASIVLLLVFLAILRGGRRAVTESTSIRQS